jgi:hypothetical protein
MLKQDIGEPRSSVDGHPDNVTGDDEMTVDEEQGSSKISPLVKTSDHFVDQCSTFSHHLTTTTGGRSQQSHLAHILPGTSIYAGTNHEVMHAQRSHHIFSADLDDSFMAHPEIMLPMPDIDDPTQRFVSVVKFYLSGWHIKPP